MADLPFPADTAFLTVKEVSDTFRVCPKTVRRWVSSGHLPALRLGRDWRIARADLKTFAAARGNPVLAHVL